MADYTPDIDGTLTLDQIKSRCEVEQDGGFQLQKIKFGTNTQGANVFLVNKTEFMSKPIGRLKHLLFVPVGTSDPDKLKKQKVDAEGWTFICDEQIYVQSQLTRVQVFGKRNL